VVENLKEQIKVKIENFCKLFLFHETDKKSLRGGGFGASFQFDGVVYWQGKKLWEQTTIPFFLFLGPEKQLQDVFTRCVNSTCPKQTNNQTNKK
jgi:hypothetical protein